MAEQFAKPGRVPGLRGMLGFPRQQFDLRFGAFTVQPKLPTIPKRFGHFDSEGPCIGMLANDRRACCVFSGFAHDDQLSHYASKRPPPRYTDEVVEQQYLEFNKGKDEGTNPEEAARWRVGTGMKDADGQVHKVKAFALIDSLSELAQATYMLGSAGCGLYMPDSAESQFAAGHVWDDISLPPNEKQGHYTVCIGRNSAGVWVLSTWGRIHGATDRYLHKYMVGGIAFFSPHYMTVAGVSPEGLDENALDQAIKGIPWMHHYMG